MGGFLGAVVSGGSMDGEVLYGLEARGARFIDVSMCGADLRNADLRGAWLVRCDLRAADLRGAKGRPEVVDCALRGARLPADWGGQPERHLSGGQPERRLSGGQPERRLSGDHFG